MPQFKQCIRNQITNVARGTFFMQFNRPLTTLERFVEGKLSMSGYIQHKIMAACIWKFCIQKLSIYIIYLWNLYASLKDNYSELLPTKSSVNEIKFLVVYEKS